MRVAARTVERRINADSSDYAGATAPCACELPARYAGRHDKTFESVLGPLRFSRAYYSTSFVICVASGVNLGARSGASSRPSRAETAKEANDVHAEIKAAATLFSPNQAEPGLAPPCGPCGMCSPPP